MSPSIANIVVQIAAEERASNQRYASEERVIERLQKLGFPEDEVRAVLENARELGIVKKTSHQLEVVGAR